MSDLNEYDIEDLLPSSDKKSKKSHKNLLDEIRGIEEDDYISPSGFSTTNFLPSSLLKEPEKKDRDEEEQKFDGYDPDQWFNEMLSFQSPGKIRKSRLKDDLFDGSGIISSGKKKKKKKKKEGKKDFIDYKKEFSPEIALYKNLLIEQNRFVEALQKEFDAMKSSKSSSRGITKQITDLVKNITEARTLSMQLVEKNVNAKKLIEELNLKQKKELGAEGLIGDSMADFGSSYIKQLLTDRNVLYGTEDVSVSEYSDDDLISEIEESLGAGVDEDRSEDTEKYLKYENRNVKIYVNIYGNDVQNYEFSAEDEDGEEIFDYPLPNHTNISINRSTNIATDAYGAKYPIIWLEEKDDDDEFSIEGSEILD